MKVRPFVLWLAALTLAVASGVQVAISTHEVRQLHMALQDLQRERDRAVEEYSRLQLELAAVAAYQNIERTAEEELDMRFPAAVERVDP